MGYIAGQTKNIPLGTAAIIFPLRHPIDLAKGASSIDQLSNGRLILGIAVGDRPIEYPAYGRNFERRDILLRILFMIFIVCFLKIFQDIIQFLAL